MRICLYLEFYNFFNGKLFKNIGTGLLSSYRNQKTIFDKLGIGYSEKWDNDCDIFISNTPWLRSIYYLKKARKQGKKTCVWSHVTAEDAEKVFRFMPFILPLFKKYLMYSYGLADMVFCPTMYTRSLLIGYGLDETKLKVMSNGVDLKNFYPDENKRKEYRERFGLRRITVGTVGLVIPRKGTDDFIELAGRFPEVDFIWYGKIYNSLLVKGVDSELPANLRFTGFVEDANSAFNSLDIFFFPSFEENQGMSILEAAAVGLPILVRDIPVYKTWLENEANCLKGKNINDFEKCLNALITGKQLRERLGTNALALAKNESLDNIKARLLEYIS